MHWFVRSVLNVNIEELVVSAIKEYLFEINLEYVIRKAQYNNRSGKFETYVSDDLINESYIVFENAFYGYKPNMGTSFRTFFLRCLDNRFYLLRIEDSLIRIPWCSFKRHNLRKMKKRFIKSYNLCDHRKDKYHYERILLAINNFLKEDEKKLLGLKFGLFGYDELSLREMGKIYDVSYETIRNRLFKIYDFIRDVIEI